MPDTFLHPKTTLDKAFEISVLLKMLDGLLEIVGGLTVLLVHPESVVHWTHILTKSELAEDPHSFVANSLVHWANSYTRSAAVFAAVYLLSHGVVKVVLVYEVLRNRLWAYVGLIAVTSAFIVYQLYELARGLHAGLILLTVFDVVVVVLTWKEYRQQRERRTLDKQSDFS